MRKELRAPFVLGQILRALDTLTAAMPRLPAAGVPPSICFTAAGKIETLRILIDTPIAHTVDEWRQIHTQWNDVLDFAGHVRGHLTPQERAQIADSIDKMASAGRVNPPAHAEA